MATELFKCDVCNYKTTRQYNLTRHMLRHIDDGTTCNPEQDHNVELTCEKCSKSLANKYSLKTHLKTCTGPKEDTVACPHCCKVFAYRWGKYRHVKICQKKPANTSDDGLVTQMVNNGTINNTTNNNTTNNNTINIVVFNPDDIPFLTDHMDELLPMLLDTNNKEAFLQQYSRLLLERDENKCVKKTNLRSSHSQVHVGNNDWETRSDSTVYPGLMCNIASTCSDKVGAHRNDRKFKELDKYIGCMCDNGYCNSTESEEKHMKKEFEKNMNGVKGIVFDTTPK